MTTTVGVFSSALVCICVASCGGVAGNAVDWDSSTPIDRVDWDSGTPIDFVPSVVSATRAPKVCGVANPPFVSGDLFDLEIDGAATTGAPDDRFSFTFDSPGPPAGTPIVLSVLPFMPQGISVTVPASGPTTYYSFQRGVAPGPNASVAAGGLNFVYFQGSNSSEIDTGAFDAAIFTVTQLPTKDGDPLAVRLQIHFVDDRHLDQTYSSPLSTEVSRCPQP